MLRLISDPFIVQKDPISDAYVSDIKGCGVGNNIVMGWWRVIQPNLTPMSLMVQKYNPKGIKLGTPLTLVTGGKDAEDNKGGFWLSIASVKDSGFIAAWRNIKSPISIYKQSFDASNKAKEPAFLISNTTPGAGNAARENFILVFDDLSSVVIWRGEEETSPSPNTYGQWFDIAGKKIGNEFILGQHSFGIRLASLSQQNFGLIFQLSTKSYLQLFNANGSQITEPAPLDTDEDGQNQFDAEIIRANENKYLVAWKRSYNPYGKLECRGQLFFSNEKFGPKFVLPCANPGSIIHSNNQFYVAYLDTDNYPYDRDKPDFQPRGTWVASYDLTGKITANPYYIATNATTLFTALIPFANDSAMIMWVNGEVTYYGQTFSLTPTINKSPTIASNQITIQGQRNILSATNLNALDLDSNSATLRFVPLRITDGGFRKINSDTDLTSFTQEEIMKGEVSFFWKQPQPTCYRYYSGNSRLTFTPPTARLIVTDGTSYSLPSNTTFKMSISIPTCSANRLNASTSLHMIVGQIILIHWLMHFCNKILFGDGNFAKHQQLWAKKSQVESEKLKYCIGKLSC